VKFLSSIIIGLIIIFTCWQAAFFFADSTPRDLIIYAGLYITIFTTVLSSIFIGIIWQFGKFEMSWKASPKTLVYIIGVFALILIYVIVRYVLNLYF
jgi:hypothetical protein